jgi:hypothetical protein
MCLMWIWRAGGGAGGADVMAPGRGLVAKLMMAFVLVVLLLASWLAGVMVQALQQSECDRCHGSHQQRRRLCVWLAMLPG